MLQRRERVPVAAASVLLLGVALADALTGRDTVLVSLLVTGPLLVAAFSRPAVTAAVGLAALTISMIRLPLLSATDGNDVVRVLSIAASSGLAVFIAARREERESQLTQMTDVAEAAQAAVLWPVPSRIADLHFADRYVSANAIARIGGDLYEVVDSPYGVRLIVGDVRGKGLPAVRLASAVLGSFREAAQSHADLKDVQRSLDAAVSRLASPEDFVTALLVELQGPTGRILSCGHPMPLMSACGVVTTVDANALDFPLGFGSDAAVQPAALPVPPGTRLLLHTDGLLEARSRDGTFFPAERHFADLMAVPLPEVLDALLSRLSEHCSGGVDDDVGLLLVERDAAGVPVAHDREAPSHVRGIVGPSTY